VRTTALGCPLGAAKLFPPDAARSVLRLLTNGCRLLLGSDARKAALIKAFDLPAIPANERSVFPHPPDGTDHLIQ
jgi:hypothetical protein